MFWGLKINMGCPDGLPLVLLPADNGKLRTSVAHQGLHCFLLESDSDIVLAQNRLKMAKYNKLYAHAVTFSEQNPEPKWVLEHKDLFDRLCVHWVADWPVD